MQRTTPPPQAELTVAPAAVTAVYTPAALVEAVAASARDIEVRGHLDLRTLDGRLLPLGRPATSEITIPEGMHMRSMRVRSRRSPSAPDTCGADAACVSGEARVCTAVRAYWTAPLPVGAAGAMGLSSWLLGTQLLYMCGEKSTAVARCIRFQARPSTLAAIALARPVMRWWEWL